MAVYLMEMVTMTAKRSWFAYSAALFDEEGLTRTKGRRASFYVAFGTRASEMVNELAEQRASATGTALVVSKTEIIQSKLDEMGINIGGKHRSKKVRLNHDAYNAGASAASKMNLGRPFGANTANGELA